MAPTPKPVAPLRYCKSCTALAIPGQTKCAKHAQYQRDYNAIQRAIRRSTGTCLACPARTSHQYCEECKARYRANRARKALITEPKNDV